MRLLSGGSHLEWLSAVRESQVSAALDESLAVVVDDDCYLIEAYDMRAPVSNFEASWLAAG